MADSSLVAEVFWPRTEGGTTLVNVALLNGMCVTVGVCGAGNAWKSVAPTRRRRNRAVQFRLS